jgi:multidrug efflux pump subunit AcrA (membrane-fusion protein)
VALAAVVVAAAPVRADAETLTIFRALTAAQRWLLFSASAERSVHKVERSVLTLNLVERGTLQSARYRGAYCQVRSGTKGDPPPTTIKWVVREGSRVKKGDRLVELDDSKIQKELAARRAAYYRALAPEAKLRLVQRLNAIGLQAAEAALERAGLDVQVEQARIDLERARARARVKEAHARADVQAVRPELLLAKARLEALEAELANYVLRAEQDGIVAYHVDLGARGGGDGHRIAPGEPASEGQRFLDVFDPSQMQVRFYVHGPAVPLLRKDDPRDRGKYWPASVRVDGLPNRIFQGHVKFVDNLPRDSFFRDIEAHFPAIVSFDTVPDGLPWGMNADVTITAQVTAGPVLNVPTSAVAATREKQLCFVVKGREVHEREVVLGRSNGGLVEIRSGLEADEEVLLSPAELTRPAVPKTAEERNKLWPSWPESLGRFRKLSPAERLRLVEIMDELKEDVAKVTRGLVEPSEEVVERGTLEATRKADLVCTLEPGKQGAGNRFLTIKWLVENGATVKKGDKLIEFDAGALPERLRERAQALAWAEAARAKAEETLWLVRKENALDLRLAELKQKGDLHADLKRLREQARQKEEQAQSDLRDEQAWAARRKTLHDQLQAELRRYVVRAPQDGYVVYYVPESARHGLPAGHSIIAEGEPVRLGQKLMQVADPSAMQVRVLLREPLAARLWRPDAFDAGKLRQARVHVEALPDRVVRGHVTAVEREPVPGASLPGAKKYYYHAIVTIDDPLPGLKPGMTANVSFGEPRPPRAVLRVPLSAVVADGPKRLCFVRTNQGVYEREVVLGKDNGRDVEIKTGLAEGERVLVVPRILALRIGLLFQQKEKLLAKATAP